MLATADAVNSSSSRSSTEPIRTPGFIDVSSIVAPDAHTLAIDLKHPSSFLMDDLAGYSLERTVGAERIGIGPFVTDSVSPNRPRSTPSTTTSKAGPRSAGSSHLLPDGADGLGRHDAGRVRLAVRGGPRSRRLRGGGVHGARVLVRAAVRARAGLQRAPDRVPRGEKCGGRSTKRSTAAPSFTRSCATAGASPLFYVWPSLLGMQTGRRPRSGSTPRRRARTLNRQGLHNEDRQGLDAGALRLHLPRARRTCRSSRR